MDKNQKKYLNALNIILYQNYGSFRKLLQFFKSPEKVWFDASIAVLEQIGLKPQTVKKFFEMKKCIDVEQEFEKTVAFKIEILSTEELPFLLKEIYDPPVVLYAQGNLDVLNNQCLSIVGTRNISVYGKEICKNWINEFIAKNLTLVSGYAYGVDFEVHKAVIENSGHTIAVLAGGLNKKYPNYPRKFEEDFLSTGLFISEYPLNIESQHYHFPIRNRIISGLSKAILILEAQEKSGSLITAKSALEQNREVFAVPGSILNPQSSGTNLIIKKAEAQAALSPSDVLQIYGLNKSENDVSLFTKKIGFDSKEEQQIYELLKQNNLFFDEISNLTKINTVELSSILSLMEIKGFIKNLGGARYGVFTGY